MIGLPVIDVFSMSTRIVKIVVFVSFYSFFIGYASDIVGQLGVVTSHFHIDLLSSIDFGCFAERLGLVGFLNSVIAEFYLAFGFLISAVGAFVVGKMHMFLYSLFFRV